MIHVINKKSFFVDRTLFCEFSHLAKGFALYRRNLVNAEGLHCKENPTENMKLVPYGKEDRPNKRAKISSENRGSLPSMGVVQTAEKMDCRFGDNVPDKRYACGGMEMTGNVLEEKSSSRHIDSRMQRQERRGDANAREGSIDTNFRKCDRDERAEDLWTSLYVASKPCNLCEGRAMINYKRAQAAVALQSYDVARTIFLDALSELKLNLITPSSSMLVVRIYHGIGYASYCLGNSQDALKYFRSALEAVERWSLGDLYEAASSHCIGILLYIQGPMHFKESLAMLEQTLAIFEEYFGKEAVSNAGLLTNMGHIYFHRSTKASLTKALGMYEGALSIQQKHQGEGSFDVASTICNIGRTCQCLGQLDESLRYFEKVLCIVRNPQYGFHGRDVVAAMKRIADVQYKKGEVSSAISTYETAVLEAKSSLGPFDAELASILKRLGDIFYETHAHSKALSYYVETLQVEEVTLSCCDPNILVTLLNISRIYRQRGDFQTALVFFKSIHYRTIKAYGPNSLESANTLSNIGLIEFQLGHYEAAFVICQDALQIQRDCHGSDDNVDVASSLNSLGLVMFHQGMQSMARDCFYDSLRIRRLLLGPDHHDVATVWYNIGTFHLETGDSEEAVRSYKETLRIERHVLGQSHQDVVLTLHHIGLIYHERGELEEALHFLEEAYEILREKPSLNQEAVGKLLNLMGNIYMQLADIESMMKCYVEASRMCGDGLIIGGFHYYYLRKILPPSAKAA